MKTQVKYLIVIVFTLFMNAYKASASDTIKVSIDWEHEVNRNHKYKDDFSKKDTGYVEWLYLTNKKIEVLDPNNTSNSWRKKSKSGNAPLVFTIEKDGEVTYEEIRNAVHPSRKKRINTRWKDFLITTPEIIGSLPKGVVTYTSDSGKRRSVGIIIKETRDVSIEILNGNKELVHILENETLTEGEYKYKWNASDFENDKYYIKYTVDTEEMITAIEVEPNEGWFARLINKIF